MRIKGWVKSLIRGSEVIARRNAAAQWQGGAGVEFVSITLETMEGERKYLKLTLADTEWLEHRRNSEEGQGLENLGTKPPQEALTREHPGVNTPLEFVVWIKEKGLSLEAMEPFRRWLACRPTEVQIEDLSFDVWYQAYKSRSLVS